jgi:hypothetical protein
MNNEVYRFEWGYVTHPGVWACGGGRQDLPPVLVGITFQVPQSQPEYAWWCYLGPRPVFENEFDADLKDKRYLEQCSAIPVRITQNMKATGRSASDAYRAIHPLRLGDLVDGKRVIETFWEWSPDRGDVPKYRLEGE